MQISLAAQQIRSIAHIWVVTHHQYAISALIPRVEKSDVGPKCWLFSQPTTNIPFDFHIIYSLLILQVDKLKISNTSTTKPTEEKQAKSEEEDNRTNKMQGQCSVRNFFYYLNTWNRENKVTIEIDLVLFPPPATTLNSRLLRISQFKGKFSYFMKKI